MIKVNHESKERRMLKQKQASEMVQVWDILIRVFHWSLLLFVLILFVTEDDYLEVHAYAGYTVVMLLGFRILWGFVGTYHARFSNFITTPLTALEYLKNEISGDAKRYIGHNPAGAIMIFALIVTLFLTGFTGMATIATEGRGPLADTFIASISGVLLGEIHGLFTNLILGLIILHILGVIFSSFAEEENLLRAMITGKKKKH